MLANRHSFSVCRSAGKTLDTEKTKAAHDCTAFVITVSILANRQDDLLQINYRQPTGFGAAAFGGAALAASSLAESVFSQVKSGSLRPK